jgi:hypothetical protein
VDVVTRAGRAREALALGVVVAATAGVLAWGGWAEYSLHADTAPTVIEEGGSDAALGAAWGPATLADVTDLRDPEDPLPEGAQVIEVVIPVAFDGDYRACSVVSLTETAAGAERGRPGAPARAWPAESFAELVDDVSRLGMCDQEWSGSGELRALFIVPGDIADELVVQVDVPTDTVTQEILFSLHR